MGSSTASHVLVVLEGARRGFFCVERMEVGRRLWNLLMKRDRSLENLYDWDIHWEMPLKTTLVDREM